MAGMISPERNWAPKLGAFPAGLLLRISVRPGRAVQDDGVHGECPKDGDCGAKLAAHPQGDGGFDGHCNQDGSRMPRVTIARGSPRVAQKRPLLTSGGAKPGGVLTRLRSFWPTY